MDKLFGALGTVVLAAVNVVQHHVAIFSCMMLLMCLAYMFIKVYAYTNIRDNDPVKNLEKSLMFQLMFLVMLCLIIMNAYQRYSLAYPATNARWEAMKERPSDLCTPKNVELGMRDPLITNKKALQDCLKTWSEMMVEEFFKVRDFDTVTLEVVQNAILLALQVGVLGMVFYELYQYKKKKTANVAAIQKNTLNARSDEIVPFSTRQQLEAEKGEHRVQFEKISSGNRNCTPNKKGART